MGGGVMDGLDIVGAKTHKLGEVAHPIIGVGFQTGFVNAFHGKGCNRYGRVPLRGKM